MADYATRFGGLSIEFAINNSKKPYL